MQDTADLLRNDKDDWRSSIVGRSGIRSQCRKDKDANDHPGKESLAGKGAK
jgi:hypothetical protein